MAYVPVFLLTHLEYLFAAVAAYFCGCFNGALMTSRLFFHDDVRAHGSGNAGLTNFYRSYGAKYALLVVACDMLKAVVAVQFAAWLGALYDPRFLDFSPLTAQLRAAYVLHFKYWAGLFCMLGHMFPCTAKFHGGKGVLCSATLMLMLDWRIALVSWGLFFLLWLTTRYVSLGSVSVAIIFPFLTWFVFRDGFVTVIGTVMSALVLWAHRGNIKRLLNGTESKFRFHAGTAKEEP